MPCPFLYGSERKMQHVLMMWHKLFGIHISFLTSIHCVQSEFTPTNTAYIVLSFIEECLFCDKGIKQIDTFVS